MKIRPATAADIPDISKIHVDGWKLTYKGIVPEDFLETLSYEQRQKNVKKFFANKENRILVATNREGKVIGFASYGQERTRAYRYKGEIYALYIADDYQRQGIGTLLIQKIVKEFMAMGLKSMMLWILKENPAYNFYASLGGKVAHEGPTEYGGKILNKVAYGWDDIGRIHLNLMERAM